MVTYNLKNNKTRKTNILSNNGKNKNKNINRKTLKNKKNKYNKHNKKNKHNKNAKKYLTSTKKRLTDRNKHNRTKKIVGGGLLTSASKIKTGLKFGKTTRTLKRLFSASRKKSKDFFNDENLHTLLRQLLDIEKNRKSIIEHKIVNFIKDILTYIYFELSSFRFSSKLDDPCIANILKRTKINDYLEKKDQLYSTFYKKKKYGQFLGKSHEIHDYLELITLDKLNVRFKEFLTKLIEMNNSSTAVILSSSSINEMQKQQEQQTKPELKKQITINNNSNINKITFRFILNKKRDGNDGHDDNIYYYSKSNEGYVGFICKNKPTHENEYDIPIKIEEFTLLTEIKEHPNTSEFTQYFEDEIYKYRDEIKDKLLTLFCYYTIFRVIDGDKKFTEEIARIKNKKEEQAAKEEKNEGKTTVVVGKKGQEQGKGKIKK